jgi:hypothetical protein
MFLVFRTESKEPNKRVIMCQILKNESLYILILVIHYLETVRSHEKNCNFHFDLQLHPTVLNGTYLYCQMIDFIPIRA